MKIKSEKKFVNNVKYLGRTKCLNDIVWISLSGSGIEFLHTGESCQVTLLADSSVTDKSLAGHEPRMGILVNGHLVHDILMDSQQMTIDIDLGGDSCSISTNNYKDKKISIIKLSESSDSTAGISEIVTDGHIQATEDKTFKIEFIGDSITCGYGIDGTLDDVYKSSNENFMKSYAYLAAEKLDFDYSVVATVDTVYYQGIRTVA